MRKAMTIIEVLVIIGIIGILIALLIPAVMAARRQAEKIKNPPPVVQPLPAKLNLANGQLAIRLRESEVWAWLHEHGEGITVEETIVTNDYNPHSRDIISDRQFILFYRKLNPSVFENNHER